MVAVSRQWNQQSPIPTLIVPTSRDSLHRHRSATFCIGKREPKSRPFQSRSWTNARQFSRAPRRTGVEMHKEHTFFEKATRKPIALCCGPTFRERKGLPVAVNEAGCAYQRTVAAPRIEPRKVDGPRSVLARDCRCCMPRLDTIRRSTFAAHHPV